MDGFEVFGDEAGVALGDADAFVAELFLDIADVCMVRCSERLGIFL